MVPFNPAQGLIFVEADIFGPSGSLKIRLALDTGATRTMISLDALVRVGFNPNAVARFTRVTTGSGTVRVPVVSLVEICTLGRAQRDWDVMGHQFPVGASFDGLLGLDFLRGHLLTLDFVKGQIDLV